MASLPFLLPAFFIAGAACALGPIIIHLLNRRRYREVNWAAMDFLREAVQRNRRIMEIRDIVLLILRTAAIVLIGAAIAQPFIPSGGNIAWQLVLLLGVGSGLCAIVAAALWSDQWIRLGAAAAAVLFAAIAGWLIYTQSNAGTSDEQQLAESNQPVHAILAIDNSLSMGYQSHAGTLLDVAKNRAKELVNRLPLGSRVSVIPLCGSPRGVSLDPYRTANDAIQAIDAIPLVDRSADFRAAVTLAEKAAESSPNLGKRMILFGDQQLSNWHGATRPEELADVPPMQIVAIAAESSENSWIADFRLEDGLADTETEAKLIVELRHSGETDRRGVQVKISQLGKDEDEGEELATQTIDLPRATAESAGTRQLVFNHVFGTVQPEPGRPAYIALRVSITADQLPDDDERYLVVPVVAALPVVFVDQYSDEDEIRDRNLHGETFPLRRLLAPQTQRGEAARHLVRVHHVKLEQLDRAVLEDARLVVVAGVPDPGTSVPLLREYVQQGGQLVIAAGGAFAPDRWQELAWLNGAGILPTPLAGDLLGKTPEESPDMLMPLQLSYPSLQNQRLFKLAGVSDNELADLYAQPYFFKIAQPIVTAEARREFVAAEAKRLDEQSKFLAEAQARGAKWAEAETKGTLSQADRTARTEDQQRREQLDPAWLVWKNPGATSHLAAPPEDPKDRARWLESLAETAGPQVLARFDNEAQTPYLVERKIGAGQVLFVSSGIEKRNPTWTTLRDTDAMLLFDRILRGMIESTLQQRTHEGLDQYTLPLAAYDPGVNYALYRPIPPEERNIAKVTTKRGDPDKAAREGELLDAGFIGAEQRALTLHHLLSRGIYRVVGKRPDASADAMEAPVLDVQLAINGPSEESSLAALTRKDFDERTEGSKLRWIGPNETISLEGASQREQDLWWYAALAVLLVLLVELGILAWPSGEQQATATANQV